METRAASIGITNVSAVFMHQTVRVRVPDIDSDGDGVEDCDDGCPNDPSKTLPGFCGCGIADLDSDRDGLPDCIDECPHDPNKTSPRFCGCGAPDRDSDGDFVFDCDDGCPNDPDKIAPGDCGCGVPEFDSDGDGLPDCLDNCPLTPNPAQADSDADGVGDACVGAAGTNPAPLCGSISPLGFAAVGLWFATLRARKRRRLRRTG